MAFFDPKFKDLMLKEEHITARVRLSIFGGRFRRAQAWLDREIMNKMEPYVPYRTGVFLRKIKTWNLLLAGTGKVRVSVPPQGRRLYNGINPSTGAPYHWTNPLTQPRWGEYTINTYHQELVDGVRAIIQGKGRD